MTQQEIERGASIAYEAFLWVLFVRKPDMLAGELRELVRRLFGPEVDAELARGLDSSAGGSQ